MEKSQEPTINAILVPNKSLETAQEIMPMLYEVILQMYTPNDSCKDTISQFLRETVLQHCTWLKSETIHLVNSL